MTEGAASRTARGVAGLRTTPGRVAGLMLLSTGAAPRL